MSNTDQESPKSVDVYELLAVFMDQTASVAWIKLGLQPDFINQSYGLDLEQAKVAIDAVSSLASLTESQLSEEDRHQVQALVRNLKLNYVNKAKEAQG